MQYVARVKCETPEAMFVVHSILLNIAAYVGEQIAAARATAFWRRSNVTVSMGRIMQSTRPSKPMSSGSSQGAAQGSPGATEWTADDVPLRVRRAVYTSDETELQRVDGLTGVHRVPEGELTMYSDSNGCHRLQPVRTVHYRAALVLVGCCHRDWLWYSG